MRKILLFSAAFLLALITMPFFFGLLTEYRVKHALNSENLPQGMIVDIKSYDRGYFSSHALVNVSLIEDTAVEPGLTLAQIVSFNIEGDIQHGPLFKVPTEGYRVGIAHVHAFINAKDLALANENLAQRIGSIFSDQNIIQGDAVLDLFGAFDVKFHSSATNYQANGDSINWGGINGNVSVSHNGNAIKSSFDISPLLMQSQNQASLDFSRVTLQSDAKRDSGWPWVGEHTLSIPSLYLKNDQGDEFRFSNLVLTTQSKVDHQLSNIVLDAKADNMQIFSQAIQNTEMRILFDKLDAKSLVEFSKLTNNNLNEPTDAQRQALTQSLITLLSPGALIDFQYDMLLAEGPVHTKLTLQFPDLTQSQDKDKPELIAQQLIKELQATLAMQAPNQWLETSLYNMALSELPSDDPKTTTQDTLRENISNQLKALAQAGILVHDDNHYAFQVNYLQGGITLNGNKLTQEDILRLMAMFSNHQETPATPQ